MKKIIALMLALIMVFGLCACKGPAADDKPSDQPGTSQDGPSNAIEESEGKTEEVKQHTGFYDYTEIGADSAIDTARKSTVNSDERISEITLAANQEIKTWFAWQSGRGRNETVLTIWEPLAYNKDAYELEGCLAKDWRFEQDNTHLIVEIYDYIYDIDGNHITAEDVKFSIEQAQGAGMSGDYKLIDHVDILNDYTVDIVWKSSWESNPALASIMLTPIASQKAFADHDFATDPCGTGSYYLESQVIGSTYTLKRNPNYWQKDELRCSVAQANVDTINIEFISDASMRYIAFENGEVYNYQIDANNLPDFMEGGKHYGKYTVIFERNAGRYGLAFNQSKKDPSGFMSDLNFRLALAYAIDSEGIIAALGEYGYYQVHGEAGATCNGYNPEWDKLENYYSIYDTKLAKEYLDKTGYKGEELIMLVQSGQTCGEIATQIIQQMLGAIGVNVKLMSLEQAVLHPTLADVSAWDLWFFMWAGEDIGQQWSRQLDINSFETGYNETGMNEETHPGFQKMIEDVQKNSTRTPELIDQIQAYLCDNCIQYSMFGQINYWAVQDNMAKMVYSGGHKDFNWGGAEYYLD